MNNEMHNSLDQSPDPALEHALDQLGESDRSAPDTGFESRILAAVNNELTPAPIPIVTHQQRAPFWWGAIAACAVIAAGVGLFMAGNSTVGPTGFGDEHSGAQQTLVALEADLDAFEELGALSEQLETGLAELDLLTDSMDAQLAMPSVFLELTSDDSMQEGSL